MKYRKRFSLPRGGHGEFRQLRVMENRFHECGEHARGGAGWAFFANINWKAVDARTAGAMAHVGV